MSRPTLARALELLPALVCTVAAAVLVVATAGATHTAPAGPVRGPHPIASVPTLVAPR